MASPATFWAEALPWARQVHAAMPEMFVSVVLAQWAEETAYGGPDWSPNNNPGNVGSFDGQPVNKFPTMQTGVNAYMQTLQNGYYPAVLAAKTWAAQCYALGVSPWASGHYEAAGGPPGEDLIKIVENYNLTQYDGAAPTPTPPTPTSHTEDNMIAHDTATGGYWVARANADIYTYAGAPYIGPLPKYTTAWGIGTAANPVVGIVSDNAGGFTLACDAGGAEPTIYHIPSDGQFAK